MQKLRILHTEVHELVDGYCMHSPLPWDGQHKDYMHPACVWYEPNQTGITISSKAGGGEQHEDHT